MKRTPKPLRTLGVVTIATVLTLCVYVLSYGPAYWLVWTFKNPRFEKTIAVFYWPLDLLVQYGPVEIADVMVKYCDLWYPG